MLKKIIAVLCALSMVFLQGNMLNAAVVDKVAPTIKSASPKNNQTSISVNRKIRLTFSENIYAGTSFSKIKLTKTNGVAVKIKISISKNILYISHTYKLDYNSYYVLSISAKAIKDKEGNQFKKAVTIRFKTKAIIATPVPIATIEPTTANTPTLTPTPTSTLTPTPTNTPMPTPTSTLTPTPTATPTPTPSPVLTPAPAFTLTDLDGKQVSLSDFRGKNVFINFWATWCGACTGELPYIESIYQENNSDLVILAINYAENASTVSNYMIGNGYHFKALLNTSGSVFNDYNNLTKGNGIPQSFFIDKNGNIIAQRVGYMTKEQMEAYIRALTTTTQTPVPVFTPAVTPLPTATNLPALIPTNPPVQATTNTPLPTSTVVPAVTHTPTVETTPVPTVTPEGTASPTVTNTPTTPNPPKFDSLDNNDKTIRGRAESGDAVTLKTGSKTLGTAIVNSSGKFSLTIKPLIAGTVVEGTVEDEFGNTSKVAKVTVKDVIPPFAPKVNAVSSKSKTVTGKTEARAIVTVKVGTKKLWTATADKKGAFTVKITAQKAKTMLSVTATDKAGNTSKTTKVKVGK